MIVTVGRPLTMGSPTVTLALERMRLAPENRAFNTYDAFAGGQTIMFPLRATG